MSDNTVVGIVVVFTMIFTAAVFGTTAYAVFWLDRSPFWFLAAIVVAACVPSISSITPRSEK
jgi:hypothetical protein